MKRSRKMVAWLLMLMLVLSTIPTSAQADTGENEDQAVQVPFTETLNNEGVDGEIVMGTEDLVPAEGSGIALSDAGQEYQDDDRVTVIVELEGESLLDVALMDSGTGSIELFSASAKGQKLERDLLAQHAKVRGQIQAFEGGTGMIAFGKSGVSEGYDYTTVLNGFSMEMRYGDIKRARALSGVKNVFVAATFALPETKFEGIELSMFDSVDMVGASDAWDLSYDGSGMAVAILDTGLDTDHEAFSSAVTTPDALKYSKSAMEALVAGSTLASEVTGSETYVSEKVPYAYDYADGDTNVNGDISHGTHVAGTIAADCDNLRGVAPKAQLMIMKVFGDGAGSTSDDIILAGLDDAVKLGADAINMSLGSTAGFSDSRTETVDNAYSRCNDAGISLMVAAGNEYFSAYGSHYGNNLPLTSSPDTATVASPSTVDAALSIASVQNAKVKSMYFMLGDEKIPYANAVNADTQSSYDAAAALVGGSGTHTNSYVVIPGVGTAQDYSGISAEGRIALVARGETTFSEKAANAKAAGATAIIIYNNAAGGITPALSEDTIPTVGISKADGEKLISAANKTITIGTGSEWSDRFVAEDAANPSEFSNWGPAPDLAIKPEIAAPGGNIYSASLNGGYEMMSGTSMATPHMAGMAALVRQYLKARGYTDTETLQNMTDALLMSSAVPSVDDEGDEYSPRKQGAGVANVHNAVTAKAYLSVDGSVRPKAELGESDTGAYSFTFSINSMTTADAFSTGITTADAFYTINTVSLMEGITTKNGVSFTDHNSDRLTEGVDYYVSYEGLTDGKLFVPAEGSATVKVTLTLTEALRTYIEENFEYGNYVEGYVYLTPADGADGVKLTLPYLGFYGDWEEAPAFEVEPDEGYLLQPMQFATVDANVSGYYLGQNGDGTFDYEKLAFSPKRSSGLQYLANIVATRRNLEAFNASIKDSSGSVLWQYGREQLRKSFYSPSYGSYSVLQILLDGWNGRYYNEATEEYDGEYAPAGQYYDYTLSGVVGQNSEEGLQTKEFKLYLDSQAPAINDFQIYKDEDGKFYLTFLASDDHFVNRIEVGDANGKFKLTGTTEGFKEITEAGAVTRVSFDLTGIGDFLANYGLNPGRLKLFAYDYALNVSEVYVDIGPQSIALENAAVEVGKTRQLNYTIRPERMTGASIIWASSDESIAKVDEKGVVTGIKDGKAIITATAVTGLTATCVVTVGTGITEEEAQNNFGDTPYLNDRFESEGLWYKVIGAGTAQLVKDSSYSQLSGLVVIPETVFYENTEFKVTSIGNEAFIYNYQITEVQLPETIKVIGDKAFNSCGALKSLALPDGIVEIGDRAFYFCSKLDTNIPKSVKSIGDYAFSFTGLTKVDLPEGLTRTGDNVFANCSSLKKANFPASLTVAGTRMYLDCPALEEVEVAQGVAKIPVYCFYGTKSLKKITLPEGVAEIEKGAFYLSGLTSIELPASLTTIGEFAYAGLKNCPDIIVPDTVTHVGARAFYWCWNLNSVVFGAGVTYVGTGVLAGALMADTSLDVVPEVKSESAGIALRRSGFTGKITKNGLPYTFYAGTDFVYNGILYTPIDEAEVMITKIYAEAFTSENNVVSLIIPETVTNEGDGLSYTVTAVDDRVLLKYQGAVQKIQLPDTITYVGEYAFKEIFYLNSINIPKNLKTIVDGGLSYFGWQSKAEWQNPELVIPSGVSEWGVAVFSGNKYTSLLVSEGVETIGSYAFSAIKKLTNVTLPSTLKTIGSYAFANDEALEEIELPEGLSSIEQYAFSVVPLSNVNVPDTVTRIGTSAFNGLAFDANWKQYTMGPTQVSIGNGLTSLGWNVFRSDAKINVVLNSQRNLLIEHNNLEVVPVVCWDGKTDIASRDGSSVPEGLTVTVKKNVTINGGLKVEGTLVIPEGVYVVVKDGIIEGKENVEGAERIVSELPSTNPVDPGEPSIPTPTPTPSNSGTTTATPTPTPTPEETGDPSVAYTDLNTNAWYHESVNFMLKNGYMVGTSDNQFSPGGTLTRAQLAAILYRIAGSPANTEKAGFTDVPQDAWYAEAVAWASANGIVAGYTHSTFAPHDSITREQIATMLYRASGQPQSSFALDTFPDAGKISGFAQDAMRWAAEKGLFVGDSKGMLNPGEKATRAEIASIIMRYLAK